MMSLEETTTRQEVALQADNNTSRRGECEVERRERGEYEHELSSENSLLSNLLPEGDTEMAVAFRQAARDRQHTKFSKTIGKKYHVCQNFLGMAFAL